MSRYPMARELLDARADETQPRDLRWGDSADRGAPSTQDGAVVVTIRLPVSALDLPCPPDQVRLLAMDSGGVWTVFARTAGRQDSCVTWLTRLGQGQPEDVSTLGRSCRARFQALDPLWATLVEDLGLRKATVDPGGWATLIFAGDRDVLGDLVEGGLFPVEDLEIESVRPAGELDGDAQDHVLTPTQLEALHAALDAGYYDVPRGITLRELADRLGVSASSLSERIRRAEARLVRTHLGREVREAPSSRDAG